MPITISVLKYILVSKYHRFIYVLGVFPIVCLCGASRINSRIYSRVVKFKKYNLWRLLNVNISISFFNIEIYRNKCNMHENSLFSVVYSIPKCVFRRLKNYIYFSLFKIITNLFGTNIENNAVQLF